MATFYGEIRPFAGNFPPEGWMFCEGQILQINQYGPLASVIGNTYGGNGTTTFALPNFTQGQMPLGQGTGDNLTPRELGDKGGSKTVELSQNELPAHSHVLQATNTAANTTNPIGNILAKASSNALIYYQSSGVTDMAEEAISTTGESQGHRNVMPFLGVSYIICVMGGKIPQTQ